MENFWKNHKASLIIGALASLLSLAVYILIEYATGKHLELPQKILLYIIAGVSIFIGIGIAFERVVKNYIRPQVEKDLIAELEIQNKHKEKIIIDQINDEVNNKVALKTGIIEIFENFDECEQEILSNIEKSKTTKIFIQIGKTVLGGTTNLYDYLASKNLDNDKEIKILHAGSNNPYLSEKAAVQRKSSFQEWITDLRYAEKKVDVIKISNKANLESRQHLEGYYWRVFIFDDLAYIQPYFYKRKNFSKAPVYKLSSGVEGKLNKNSLYHLFEKYFDNKWEECQPHNLVELDRYIDDEDTTVAAAIVRYNQYFIFAIPRRYINSNENEIPFHALGGKRNPKEDWIETLKREVQEEIGLPVEIESSPETGYYTTSAKLEKLKLKDSPAPYCIYKRTREDDSNFESVEILWLVGYKARINSKIVDLDELRPKAEIGALLVLTRKYLRKILEGNITYKDVDISTDGSRIILTKEVNFNYNAKAIPAGLALIMAADQNYVE